MDAYGRKFTRRLAFLIDKKLMETKRLKNYNSKSESISSHFEFDAGCRIFMLNKSWEPTRTRSEKNPA